MSDAPESRPNELALIDSWCDFKSHNENRAERTVTSYRQALVRLGRYLAEQGETLIAATPERLEDFSGRHLHQLKIIPNSRRVSVAAIRGFYGWLSRKNVIEENPARSLPAPRAGRPLPRAMSMSQAERLLLEPGLKTFKGVRDTAILAILIGAGCRASGIVNLDQEDLIWTQSAAGTERLIVRLTEKGKKQRLVPVPLETSLLVRAYLGHPDLDKIDRTLLDGNLVLFPTTVNNFVPAHLYFGEARRMKSWTIDRLVKAYGKRAKLPPALCHAHALRHLYGTELAEHDVDLLVRQALMGHASPATTEIYTHLAMRKLIATVDKASPISRMSGGPAFALANKIRLHRA